MKRIGLFLGCALLVVGCGGGGGGNGGAGGGGNGGSGGGTGGGTGGAGGQTACTEIGCDDGFMLTLKAGGDGNFMPGEYVIDTTVDGTMASCTITIGSMLESTCNALYDLSNNPNQIWMPFGGTPMSVTVTITRDGTEIVNQTYTPQYEEVQPNGEGCPPVCQQAEEEVTL